MVTPVEHVQRQGQRRRAIPIAAIIFVVGGGILEGVGVYYQREHDPETRWGLFGFLIGGVVSVWFARRLRWWLLLYIPAVWIALIPIGAVTIAATRGIAGIAGDNANVCESLNEVRVGMAQINDALFAWADDQADTENPQPDDYRRWAKQSGEIKQLFEEADLPDAFDRYVELAIQTFGYYEAGFSAMADGDVASGAIQLAKAEDNIILGSSEYYEATATCGV